MRAPANHRLSVAVLLLQPQCNMTCTFCVTEHDFDSPGLLIRKGSPAALLPSQPSQLEWSRGPQYG